VKVVLTIAALLIVLLADRAHAGEAAASRAMILGCITSAAKIHRLPPAVLVILLDVEDGRLGEVTENTNGTVDIGPMQVNAIHLPAVAVHWHATIATAYEALRDNFCANVEAGAWLLRSCLDGADGHFWEGVGDYHSRTPEHRTRYLWQVLQDVLRLRSLAESGEAAARQPMRQTGMSPPTGD
jgi:hypothetical protein